MGFIKYLPIIVLALIIISCSSPVVQKGDGILLTYTGRYENGTIFDTNDPANSGVFNASESHFTSIPITVGKGQLITGVDNALVGMKKGETKRLVIPAKEAYGTYDVQKTKKVPIHTSAALISELPRLQVRTKDEVLSYIKDPSEIVVGKLLKTESFVFNITQTNETHVSLYAIGTNETVKFNNVMWDSELLSSNSTTMVFRHIVGDGVVYLTSNGPYNASVNSTHVELTSVLHVGETFKSNGILMRVLPSGPDHYLIESNHPLAGYNLDFELTINDIMPKK